MKYMLMMNAPRGKVGAEGLAGPDQARVVRAGKNGAAEVGEVMSGPPVDM